jgi:hypothetical protein
MHLCRPLLICGFVLKQAARPISVSPHPAPPARVHHAAQLLDTSCLSARQMGPAFGARPPLDRPHFGARPIVRGSTAGRRLRVFVKIHIALTWGVAATRVLARTGIG